MPAEVVSAHPLYLVEGVGSSPGEFWKEWTHIYENLFCLNLFLSFCTWFRKMIGISVTTLGDLLDFGQQ